MAAKAARAQARIERLSRAAGCQPEAIQWMEAAMDPFPDDERAIAGYPDMVIGKSVVQAFRQKVTVNAPASASGGNWDCHIFTDSYFTANAMVQANVGSNTFFQTGQGGTQYQVGGVSVRSAAAGVPLYIPTVQSAQCLTPIVNTNIPYRVIAQGVEITNTTAPLYRQGNVVCWRMPMAHESSVFGLCTVASATLPINPSQIWDYPAVPENATNALILQGAKSWEAAEGAYIVGTLGTTDLPVIDPTGNQGVYAVSNSIAYTSPITGTVGGLYQGGTPNPDGFNPYGAYFTGLSNQTTLDVVWHYIVERFPPPTSTDLVTSSSNSCPYDPRVLEIYSKTTWRFPTGGKVSENGLGDWICNVADLLGSFGVPGMGIVKGVTKGIQVVSEMMDDNPEQNGPTQTSEKNQTIKRVVMNNKAQSKGKEPRQGPLLPNGSFRSPEAKTAKKQRQRVKSKQRQN